RPSAPHLIADRDLAAVHHLAVDTAVGMTEAAHERIRYRQVAHASDGIDVGCGATHDALHDLEPCGCTDCDLLAEEVELLPCRPTSDVYIAAEPQRMNRRPDRGLDRRDRGKVDDRDHFAGDVGEAVAGRVQYFRRAAQLAGAESGEERFDG